MIVKINVWVTNSTCQHIMVDLDRPEVVAAFREGKVLNVFTYKDAKKFEEFPAATRPTEMEFR